MKPDLPLEMTYLRVHALLGNSRANGPGLRTVIWTQGCSLLCPGCFNPDTHSECGGRTMEVAALLSWVMSFAGKIEGITITGGEPLDQIWPLTVLLREVRCRSEFSVLLLTGFEWFEVQAMPGVNDLLANVDVLITGRFDASRSLRSGMIGSSNKTVHFLTDRYRPEDLAAVPEAELLISPQGIVISTGISPIEL